MSWCSLNSILPLDAARQLYLSHYLRDLLWHTHGNRCQAAVIAEVHRNTLSRLCVEAGIPKDFGRRKGSLCAR